MPDLGIFPQKLHPQMSFALPGRQQRLGEILLLLVKLERAKLASQEVVPVMVLLCRRQGNSAWCLFSAAHRVMPGVKESDL